MKDVDDGTPRQALVASVLRAYDRRLRRARRDLRTRESARIASFFVTSAAIAILTIGLALLVTNLSSEIPTDAHRHYSHRRYPPVMARCIHNYGEEFCVAESRQNPQDPLEN